MRGSVALLIFCLFLFISNFYDLTKNGHEKIKKIASVLCYTQLNCYTKDCLVINPNHNSMKRLEEADLRQVPVGGVRFRRPTMAGDQSFGSAASSNWEGSLRRTTCNYLLLIQIDDEV